MVLEEGGDAWGSDAGNLVGSIIDFAARRQKT